MPKVRFKDIDIYYTSQGKGPAVVLLHGFLESSWIWEDLSQELKKRYRVICIDLPGHGKSDCISYLHSMDEMAESVHQVLKSLKIRRIQLAGHSMGGYVALAFAERWPDSVKNLILYQTTARADSAEKKKDRERVIELVKDKPKSFIRKSIPMLMRPVNRTRMKDGLNLIREKALETPVQGIIAALSGMRDRPNRELLLKFPPYPVNIIASDKDPRISYQESKELASISEHVILHTIKGSGHMSYIEAPNETEIAFLKALI